MMIPSTLANSVQRKCAHWRYFPQGKVQAVDMPQLNGKMSGREQKKEQTKPKGLYMVMSASRTVYVRYNTTNMLKAIVKGRLD